MGDISKKTLAVLFIIAIVLSAAATWKVLSSPAKVIVADDDDKGRAQVSFGIDAEPEFVEPVEKTGQVTFVIE